MKKTVALIVLFICFICASVSSFALTPAPWAKCANLSEYETFIDETTLPENFLFYENLASFGKFKSLIINHEDFSSYYYSIGYGDGKSVTWWLSVSIVQCKTKKLFYWQFPTRTEVVRGAQEDLQTAPSSQQGKYTFSRVCDLYYYYGKDCSLESIRIFDETSLRVIEFSFKQDYYLQNDIIRGVLNSESVKVGQEHLFDVLDINPNVPSKEEVVSMNEQYPLLLPTDSDVTTDILSDGTATTDALPEPEPTVKWWHIALPVGGGIAVVGSLAAVLLLRKKKK